MGEDMEARILERLGQVAGTPEHLASSLGVSVDDLGEPLADLERRDWIYRGAAWFGNDPTSAIIVIGLRPAGREEVERRASLETANEPIVVTRAELAAELKRRFGWTDEQIDLNPHLRGERFHFWPSIGAWSSEGPREDPS
jgi:hypothetical protein